MKKKTFRDWAIYRLTNSNDLNYHIDYSGYTILYSASDSVNLSIHNAEVLVAPESFYFIPPESHFQFHENYDNAVVLWFKSALFMDRLEFLYQIERGVFFSNPEGHCIANTFIPYKDVITYFYIPIQKKHINKLLKKNILMNFIEFIMIRSLIDIDPALEESTRNSYEKDIADHFMRIISSETGFNFRMNHYSDQLNITKRSLDNAIQTIYGCSAKKFITGKALEKAKKLLRGTLMPIKNISQEIGFSEESNFHNFFKKHTGYTPREFRTNATSTTPEIQFTFPDTEFQL